MADWKEKLKEIRRGIGGNSPAPEAARSPAARGAAPGTTQIVDLCIGLDFGTSSTKSVVRVLPMGPAFAVPLGSESGDPIEKFLAPTRLWVGPGGALALNKSGNGWWADDLKVLAMTQPWDVMRLESEGSARFRPADLAAGYLAIVLKAALGWCSKQVLPKLGAAKVRWLLNLGLPACTLDDRPIEQTFLAIGRAGWQLAQEGGQITLPRSAQVVDAAKGTAFKPRDIERESIAVIPEVAAGVATYARSPQRRPGAHLFVDVGATTLDASMFLLGEQAGEIKYVFLAADVDSDLGALRLHRFRARELARLALSRFAAAEPLKPIPDTVRNCLPSEGEIDGIDSSFADKCAVKMGAVVYQAKLKAPNELSADTDRAGRVQVLLSGGGIRLPLYDGAVTSVGDNAAPGGKQGLRVRPFQRVPIPRPDDLDAPGMTDETWSRLAVAYGLSFREEDIGRYVPSSSVTPPPRPPERDGGGSAFVSKDDV